MVWTNSQLAERFFTESWRSPLPAHDAHTSVIAPAPDTDTVVALDALVAGVHFFADAAAADVGWKSLAVNLSDLAAMGAYPRAAVFSLTWPEPDLQWLDDYSRGVHELADQYGIKSVGVTFAQGPLAVAVQVYGDVPRGQALQRVGARPGERIFVTGTLGDAGLALLFEQGRVPAADAEVQAWLRGRLHRPSPRVAAGVALRGIASSAIDVSDGLVADLGHILAASGVGASLVVDRLPLTAAVRARVAESGSWRLPLTSGDDYELCFTVPREHEAHLLDVATGWDCECSCVGEIEYRPGLRVQTARGAAVASGPGGYDHFAEPGSEHA